MTLPCIDNGGYRQFGFKLGSKYHCGKDFNCPEDTVVRATESGYIAFISDEVKGYGSFPDGPGGVIWIKKGDLFIQYGHVTPVYGLEVGKFVKKGEILGAIHDYKTIIAGKVLSVPHLHYAVLKRNTITGIKWGYCTKKQLDYYIDPDDYLEAI